MKNFEFISYKSTKEDKYMLGVATVKAYGKILLRYKHIQGKENRGDFFVAPNISYSEMSDKKNLSGFMLDSRIEEEEVVDLLREGYRNYLNQRSVSAFAAPAMQESEKRREDSFAQDNVPF